MEWVENLDPKWEAEQPRDGAWSKHGAHALWFEGLGDTWVASEIGVCTGCWDHNMGGR